MPREAELTTGNSGRFVQESQQLQWYLNQRQYLSQVLDTGVKNIKELIKEIKQSEENLSPEAYKARLDKFNETLMIGTKVDENGQNLHSDCFCLRKSMREQQQYPTLNDLNEWFEFMHEAAVQLLADQQKIMACFWPVFKDEGLEEKHLTCLMLEVNNQNNQFLQGSRLATLLKGWNSENNTLNIKLRDTVFDQIFTRFRVKSLIGMAPAENDEDIEEPESVLW